MSLKTALQDRSILNHLPNPDCDRNSIYYSKSKIEENIESQPQTSQYSTPQPQTYMGCSKGLWKKRINIDRVEFHGILLSLCKDAIVL